MLLTIVFCTHHTFKNYFKIKQRFTKYFEESFGLGSDQNYSHQIFFKRLFGLGDETKIIRAVLGTTGMKLLFGVSVACAN